MTETVILLHGLGETPLRMLPLDMALQLAGYRTINYFYPSTLYSVEELDAKFLSPLLEELRHEKTIHFVTHSLGGVLLRYHAQRIRIDNIGRAVMLAPAHHGSAIMDLYAHIPLFLWFNGPVALQSGIGDRCLPCRLNEDLDFPAGIIAGGLPSDLLSLWIVPMPQDGRTTAKGMQLKGMTDHLVVAASHETISFDPVAIHQTLYFLRHGRFLRAAP